MACFEIESWIDYAGQAASEEERRPMELHLNEGCEKCARTAEFARRMVSAARDWRLLPPPDELTAAAKALFSPRATTSLRTLLAKLVMTGGVSPGLAGVRSGELHGAKHLLYQADRYLVDLRFETGTDSIRIFLIGQIAEERASDKAQAGSPASLVWLKNGERTVAQTTCNEFGEFSIDYLPDTALRLELELKNSNDRLEIPIEDQ